MTKNTTQRSACFFILVARLAWCNLIKLQEAPSEELIKKEFIEFQRRFAKGETAPDRPDMAMFVSLEVARLSFNPTNRRVVVAYVQADSMKDVARLEDTGEGKWAEKAIWPKFSEIRKK